MSLKWFRLWTDWAHDPKILRMPEKYQLAHVRLLCMQAEGMMPATEEEIRIYLGLTRKKCHEILTEFRRNFIEISQNSDGIPKYFFKNWEKRQRKSDVSNERVARYRSRLASERNVTPALPCNVTVTDRTEQKRIEKKYKRKNSLDNLPDDFMQFWAGYPDRRKGSRKDAFEEWQKLSDDYKEQALQALPLFAASENWTKDNGEFVPMPCKYLNRLYFLDPPKGNGRATPTCPRCNGTGKYSSRRIDPATREFTVVEVECECGGKR